MISTAEIPSHTIFRTSGYNPFAVKVNPFDGNLLAIAASQNFGLKGGGRVFILRLNGSPGGRPEALLVRHFDFRDGLFDLAWSEVDREGLVVGGGDGRVYRLSINSSKAEQQPVPVHSHNKEISSLDWCPLRQDKFLSTSWDGSIKLSNGSTIRGHGGVVNEARWSPRNPNLLISVSSDRTARLWDDRTLTSTAVVISPSSDSCDFLSVDWNKYEEWNVVTASPADLLFWDIRALTRGPVNKIPGAHHRAIKRVRFSPWQGNRLASVGFDMSLRSWDLTALNPRAAYFDHFTEFTTGLDWSNFERNKIFTCSWDETIRVHYL